MNGSDMLRVTDQHASTTVTLFRCSSIKGSICQHRSWSDVRQVRQFLSESNDQSRSEVGPTARIPRLPCQCWLPRNGRTATASIAITLLAEEFLPIIIGHLTFGPETVTGYHQPMSRQVHLLQEFKPAS